MFLPVNLLNFPFLWNFLKQKKAKVEVNVSLLLAHYWYDFFLLGTRGCHIFYKYLRSLHIFGGLRFFLSIVFSARLRKKVHNHHSIDLLAVVLLVRFV